MPLRMTKQNKRIASAEETPSMCKESLNSAAVIPCRGIGDALLMMVASNHLRQAGILTTTFHPMLPQLKDWFVGHTLTPSYSIDDLKSFDLVIVENDNSKEIETLRHLYQSGQIKRLAIFYPTYKPDKHPPLSPFDQVFDATLPMAENIAIATRALVKSETPTHDNGIIVLSGLTHRLYKERVVIHPTSSCEEKNWSFPQFKKVSKHLKKRGFHPVFALSAEERETGAWEGCDVVDFPTLSALAAFLYESGYVIGNDSLLGHLASNLNIPTLIVSNCSERMRLWRPGWLKGKVLTPPKWIPNNKPFRLRSSYWRSWITPGQVLRAFTTLTYRS